MLPISESKIPKVLDYIPIVSTFSGLVRLFMLAHQKTQAHNGVIVAKVSKSWGDQPGKRGAIALIPVIGNIILGIHDHRKKSAKDDHPSLNLPVMPPEITGHILSYLGNETLSSTSLVSKEWNEISKEVKKPLPNLIIGKKSWKELANIDLEPPPFPASMYKILEEKCPFFPGKLVRDTHVLIYFPERIEGRLNDDLCALYLTTQRGLDYQDVGQKNAARPNGLRSGWVLMTKSVVPLKDCEAQVQNSKSDDSSSYRFITNIESLWMSFFHCHREGMDLGEKYMEFRTLGNDSPGYCKIMNKSQVKVGFRDDSPGIHEIGGTIAVRELPLAD